MYCDEQNDLESGNGNEDVKKGFSNNLSEK